MRKIFLGGIILFCSLIIVATGCNSVKRNAVRDVAKRDSISTTTQTQQASTTTIKNETKQTTKDNTSIEVQTPDSAEFPQNADTTIEVVKILRNLPKGSKIRVIHGVEAKSIQKNEAKKDTASQQQHKATEVHEQQKHTEVHKEAKRFPMFAAIGIIVAIGVIVLLYLIIKKYFKI